MAFGKGQFESWNRLFFFSSQGSFFIHQSDVLEHSCPPRGDLVTSDL